MEHPTARTATTKTCDSAQQVSHNGQYIKINGLKSNECARRFSLIYVLFSLLILMIYFGFLVFFSSIFHPNAFVVDSESTRKQM